jgi:hypothetical protein
MEIELGWGTHDRGEYDYFSADGTVESETLRELLRICDEYDIPITFDIVGHLLHKTCEGTHNGPYEEGWWDEDPGTDPATDPLFYAPEFAERILAAEANHELGTHTYSHILCDKVSKETIRHEIRRARETHEEFGLNPPTSIVFPRHQTPPYEVFADLGIKVIRRPIESYTAPTNPVKKFYWGATRSHPSTTLQQKHGIVETLCTTHPSLSNGFLRTGQADLHPLLRVMPRSLRQRISRRYIKSGVDAAVESDAHVHLWTHLFNIANVEQLPPIEAGLDYIAEKRDQGDIEIKPMCELPEVIENGAKSTAGD